MIEVRSDALVFFGATGDLAHKKVFRAHQDYAEDARRIVDPVLKKATPVYEYEAGSWGPSEVDKNVVPPGGWQNPTVQ
jgi:glucose-6-phosphate 1-dehydrogenase